MMEILVMIYFTLPSTSVQLETSNIDHSTTAAPGAIAEVLFARHPSRKYLMGGQNKDCMF